MAFAGGRRMLVYVPASLGAASPRAIVLVLHGGGGSALNVSTPGENPLAVFRDVADRERFVVAFPEGSPAQDGRLGWTESSAPSPCSLRSWASARSPRRSSSRGSLGSPP
jgi:poly(3-hydroxybutyrate) depolymerase